MLPGSPAWDGATCLSRASVHTRRRGTHAPCTAACDHSCALRAAAPDQGRLHAVELHAVSVLFVLFAQPGRPAVATRGVDKGLSYKLAMQLSAGGVQLHSGGGGVGGKRGERGGAGEGGRRLHEGAAERTGEGVPCRSFSAV